jgi:hypothetical protein
MTERKFLVPICIDDTEPLMIKSSGWFGFLDKNGNQIHYGKTPSGNKLFKGFLKENNNGELIGSEEIDINALKNIHKYDGIRICIKKTYQEKNNEFKDNGCNVFRIIINKNNVVIDYMWNDIVEKVNYKQENIFDKNRIPVDLILTKYTNWENNNNIEYIVNINYKDNHKFNKNGTSYEVLNNYIKDEKKYEIY